MKRLATGAPNVVLQRRPHAVGGARVKRRHVTSHLLLARVRGELAKGRHAPPVGGHRRAQVGQVLRHRAGGGGAAAKQGFHPLPLRLPCPYQVPGRDDHALFRQVAGLGRHRTRPDAAQLGVVGPVGDVAQQPAVHEDGRDDRDVGQVGSTVARVVRHRDVAGAELQLRRDPSHAFAERAEVDRNVGRVDQQPPFRVEHPAREVETLLDVHRHRRPLQHHAHLGRDGGEPVREQLQPDGIHRRSLRGPTSSR